MLALAGSSLCPAQSDELSRHANGAQAAIAANNAPLAKHELEELLKIDPRNVNAIASLGMVEFLQGEYAEASRNFEAVLALTPSLASARAFLGMCEIRQGKAEHGRGLIEHSLGEVSDRNLRIQAGLELVRSYSESGRFENAEPVLAQLAKFDPGNSDVLYALYRLHSELAASSLRKLTAADPGSAWVHEILGQNQMAQEQYVSAAEEFRKAIELRPGLTGLHFQLGEALVAEARTEEKRSLAEKEFEAELRMNPGHADSLLKLADIALERSHKAEAKVFVTRALAARPNFAEAHATLGKILEAEGNASGAIMELETAERLDPAIKATHYRLSRLYLAAGRMADAEKELAEVRRLSRAEPLTLTPRESDSN